MLTGVGLDEFEFILKKDITIGFCDIAKSWTGRQLMHHCNGDYVANIEATLIVPFFTMLECCDADFVAGFEFCQIKSLLQIVVVQIYFIHKDESVSVGRSWCAIDFSADWRLRIFKMKNETAL